MREVSRPSDPGRFCAGASVILAGSVRALGSGRSARAITSNRSVPTHPGPPDTWKSRTSYAKVIMARSGMFVIFSPPPGMNWIDEPRASGLAGLIDATSKVNWANPGHINKRAKLVRRSITLI